MNAVKITDKMFSGGSTKGLLDILRGLAIDNAINAFMTLDHEKLSLINETTGVIHVSFLPIPVPDRKSSDAPIPVSFWDMASDAVMAMQSIASSLNVVLERFGIKQINGALPPAVSTNASVKDVRMVISLDVEMHSGLNTGLQMVQLRDGMTVCGDRLNDIRAALGKERISGRIGGSDKGKIFPLMEDRAGGVNASEKDVILFLNAFNANLSFIVAEWNTLVGHTIPGFEMVTDIKFDDGIITTPEFIVIEPATDQVVQSHLVWGKSLENLKIIVRRMEIEVIGLAKKHAMAYDEKMADVEILTSGRKLVINHDGFDRFVLGTVIGVDHSAKIVDDMTRLTKVMLGMMVPVNNALMMNGYTPVVDIFGNTEVPLNVYVLPLDGLTNHVESLWQSACNIGNAIMRVTNLKLDSETKSLRVISH